MFPCMFSQLKGARLRKLAAEGLDIIRMDIGEPDAPPPAFIIDELEKQSRNPKKHGYAGYGGTPELKQAIADYYQRRFGVELDPVSETLPLLGSKEGLANIALAWLDPGDLAIVPDPGYPTYQMGAKMPAQRFISRRWSRGWAGCPIWRRSRPRWPSGRGCCGSPIPTTLPARLLPSASMRRPSPSVAATISCSAPTCLTPM
jgi:hypothetical protein